MKLRLSEMNRRPTHVKNVDLKHVALLINSYRPGRIEGARPGSHALLGMSLFLTSLQCL